MFLIKIVTGQPTMDLTPSYVLDIFATFYTSKFATIIMIACLFLVLVLAVAYNTVPKDHKARNALVCWSIAFAGIASIILIGKKLVAIGGVSPLVHIIIAGIIALLSLIVICARIRLTSRAKKE